MNKKYLKRAFPSKPSGEAFLRARFSYIFLFVFFLSVLPLSAAELPTPAELDTVGLDIGVHFIRPDSKYVTPTNTKPHYLSVDGVNFIACIDAQSTPRGFFICSDNNNFREVDLYPWPDQERCFVGGMPLSDFSCTNGLVQVEYEVDDENLKITGEFEISTFSTVVEKLLNSQYNDGGWRSALDTAFSVRALSYFSEIFEFEINQALQWLKDNRNNELKCWPKAPCNLKETSKILTLLADTNLNDSFRVINDGRNFLEQRQNYYEQGDNWTIEVTDIASGSTVTLVALNGSILYENFTLPTNGTQSYQFEANQDAVLTVIADQDVIMEIYNQNDLLRYEFQGDNLTYTVPGACWSLNLPGEPCDTGTTVYAASTNMSNARLTEAELYMQTQIESGIIRHYYGDSTDPVESALYVRRIYDREALEEDDVSDSTQDGTYLYDVLQWVLFRQNNDGYWGDEFDGDEEDDDYDYLYQQALQEQLQKTAFITMALLDSGFNRSSEPVVDAHEWVSDIEDDINQTSGGSLGAALFIVQNNAYPLLYTNPSVIILDEQSKDVSFINPTPFEFRDLAFVLSENLEDHVTIEEKDFLSAFNYRTIKFIKKSTTDQEVSGFVSVGNAGQEIARIPVLVFDAPTLEMANPDAIRVYGATGSLQLKFTKSKHSFDCSIDWESNLLSSPSFKVSRENANVNVVFSQAQTTEDVYGGEVICKSLGQEFNFPFSVQITSYVDRPLTVFPSTIVVNESDSVSSILVKNNLDVDVVVELNTNQFSAELLYPEELFLLAGTSQNITLKGAFDTNLNYTGTTRLNFETLGTSESITILVDVYSTPQSSTAIVRLVIMLTFLLIVFGTLGYLGYRYRDDLLKFLNKIPLFQSKVEIQEKKSSLVTLRSEEKHRAIMNMYSILKFQQATDQEIKKRLVGTFSIDELKEVFDKEGIALDGLEETEPEKV